MTHNAESFGHCNCQACARRAWAERDALLRAASKLIALMNVSLPALAEGGARSARFLAAADQYAAAWRDLKAAVAQAEGAQP